MTDQVVSESVDVTGIDSAISWLKEKYPDAVTDDNRDGYQGVAVDRNHLVEVATAIRDELGFDYLSSEDVLKECVERLGKVAPDRGNAGKSRVGRPNGADDPAFDLDIPMYSVDGIVRRADALQKTPEAQRVREYMLQPA